MRRTVTVALIAIALTLAGCSAQREWRTKDISGLMPPLQFRLGGADRGTLTAATFAGSVTLVYFGYTSCPDVCPTTLAGLSAVLARLPEDARKQVRVLFVSVDPERDDAAKLKAYTGAFGERFVGATGTQAQLRAFTRRYRVTYGYGDPDRQGNYEVTHSSAVFVFDGSGAARLMFRRDDGVEAQAADLGALVSET